MAKNFWFAIALCMLFSAPTVAQVQQQPGFIIFLKESPPPERPEEWFVIFPTTISAQAILAEGFHPFKYTNTEDQAFLDTANLLAERFPQVCHKNWLKFTNFETNETVFVKEFSAPKPFGFTYQGPPMCHWEKEAAKGTPIHVDVGPFRVTLTQPPTIGARPIPPPPPPPPPTSVVTPTQPSPQTPPPTVIGPASSENTPPGAGDAGESDDETVIVGPEPLPIPEDDIEGVYEGDDEDLPIPQPIPEEEMPADDEIAEGEYEPTPPPESDTSVRYPDMTGTWIIGGWPRDTAYTITQSGNQIQWTHDYMWGAGMRHAVTTGEVSELSGTSASIVIDQTFYEPDGTTNKGYYTGDVTTDENGRAVHVFWSNNSTIERVD